MKPIRSVSTTCALFIFAAVMPSPRAAQPIGERPVFETKSLPVQPDAIAPDGSEVRLLLGLQGGGLAHFSLAQGETATAVAHRTVEEVWFFLSGRGEMWRKLDEQEETIDVHAGVSISIPLGTHFQFRAEGDQPLVALGVTMPPWPGDDEAYVVDGPWTPTVPEGSGGA